MASLAAPLSSSISHFFPRNRESVVALAEACFRESVYYELRRTQCDVHGDSLILYGTVSTYYLKQIAQTLVGKIPGIQQVDNQIEVVGDTEVNRQFDVSID